MIKEYIESCGYNIGELKPYVFLLPESTTKIKYKLDGNDADNSYITSIEFSKIYKLNATSVMFNSTSSYSDRFSIDSSIEVSINEVKGYQFDDIIDKLTDNYYVIFETKLNERFILSVEFSSSYTYTKQIGENSHKLTITFPISQNIPSLQINDNIRLNNFEEINGIPCGYSNYGVRLFKMSDMDDTVISDKIIAVLDKTTIKKIDFIKNSVTYNETYENDQYTYTISFKIPLKKYTNYLTYTLLEFTKNVYACYIYTNLDNAIAIPNLFPSYTIETSEDESTLNTITITLSTVTNHSTSFEMTSDEMDDVIDDNSDNSGNNRWKPVYKYDRCISDTVKAHTLLCEYNFKGSPTGNYACLDGFSDVYNDEYNIIETYTTDETKYGFPITWEDEYCSYYNSCTIENLPNTIYFKQFETKTINVNATCNWTLQFDRTDLWEITPSSGEPGEQLMTFKYLSGESNTATAFINFEDETVKSIKLICDIGKDERFIEDGTICSETPLTPDERCEKWVDIEYNPNDQSTFICIKGNLYKKKQLYKSDNCDGDFYPTNEYKEGDLIEENSEICKNIGEEIWVEVPNEFFCEEASGCTKWVDIQYVPSDQSTFICEGYDRYTKQELYISENCDDTWKPTESYQKGELVESNSTVCGYNQPTEDSDKLMFTWGQDTVFNFKVNNKNIQTTENPYKHTFAEMGITTDTSTINCKNMFNAAFNSGGKLITFDHFPEIEKINDPYGMFAYQTSMTSCNMPYQTVGGADFRYMFRDCSSLTKINFDGWRLFTNGYYTDEMFNGCATLTEISLKNANQAFIDMIKDALFQAGLITQVNLILN